MTIIKCSSYHYDLEHLHYFLGRSDDWNFRSSWHEYYYQKIINWELQHKIQMKCIIVLYEKKIIFLLFCIDWVDSSKHRNNVENLTLLNNIETFINYLKIFDIVSTFPPICWFYKKQEYHFFMYQTLDEY